MTSEGDGKFELLGMKSVAELLYFERRYKEAMGVGSRVLMAKVEGGEGIGGLDRVEVEELVERCRKRLLPSGSDATSST